MKPMYIGRQFLSNIIHISKWCEMEGEDGEYRSIGGISLSNMPFDYVMQLVGDATMIYDLQAKNAQLRTALEEALKETK